MTNPAARSGLYIVSRWAPEKGVQHQALLFAGHALTRRLGRSETALIAELSSEGLRFDPPRVTDAWSVAEEVTDVDSALRRLTQWCALPRRPYDLLTNNCEHFVSYVTTGTRASAQVRGAAVAVASAFAVLLAIRLLPRATGA